MFDKVKDLYKMQKQAKQLKQELKNIHIEGENDGVTCVFDGQQNPVSVTIADSAFPDITPHILRKIEQSLLKALIKTIKKTQEVSAAKMKSIMGDISFGGTATA